MTVFLTYLSFYIKKSYSVKMSESHDKFSELISHKKSTTQSAEKPFKCQYCNKSFAKSQLLKIHQRIHTEEKPYKCQQCDKSFVQSSSLKTHEISHTGEKQYKCQQCEQTFSQSGNSYIYLTRDT